MKNITLTTDDLNTIEDMFLASIAGVFSLRDYVTEKYNFTENLSLN
jgi:hypothetical protein